MRDKHVFKGYRPRHDYVLLNLVEAGVSPGGVALPEGTAESMRFYVVAVGPKVEDLEIGQRVMPMGEVGQDIARIPHEKGLFLTKEANILMINEKG